MGRHRGALDRGLRAVVTASIAVAVFCLLAGSGTAATEKRAGTTANLITSYHVVSVVCQQTRTGLVRAVVKVRMRVVNYDNFTDWAQHMKLSARLVATGPGLSLQRNWKTQTTGYLTQNKTHTAVMNVATEPMSPRADWRAQLKMVWDRPAPISDVVKEKKVPFGCETNAQPGTF